MLRIALVNGPNMNLLGQRETSIYGTKSLEELHEYMTSKASEFGVVLVKFQSNHEGVIVDFLQDEGKYCSGIIINPASLSGSYSIREAIKSIGVPAIEVHMSNILAREHWHSQTVIAPVCLGQIAGLGFNGYLLAMMALIHNLQN